MICDRVLFIDDDADVRSANVQALELEGLRVSAFPGVREALGSLRRDFAGVVVSDLRMPGEDGHALFRRVRALDAELPVILITGHADVSEAVQAMHDGAYDFVAKPYAPDRLLVSVRRALATRKLVLENRALRVLATRAGAGEGLIGDSAAMRRLRHAVEQLAGADLDVVVEGETGAGKETVARALHRAAGRRGRFVVSDCADLEEAAGEVELFGAPAGAGRARPGRIEAAQGGTLFLRDVDRLPPRLQGRLLRVLESGALGAADDERTLAGALRIIAATRVPLAGRVEAGGFRPDLFHRLNGVTLQAPPLRERREDLPLLFGGFLVDACRRLRTPEPVLTAAVQLKLQTHGWPGNLRELKAYADRVALGLPEAAPTEAEPPGMADRVAMFESELLRDALRRSGGRVAEALAALRLPRKTFYDKCAKHGLRPDDFRPRSPAPRKDDASCG